MQTETSLWREEKRSCPLCRSDARRLIGRRGGAAHHRHLGQETGVVGCKQCGAIYTYPTLVPSGNPYEAEEAAEYFRIHDETRKIRMGERLAAFAESVLGKPGKMLEIGCGRGELLAGAMNRSWQCHGVEMTPEFAAIAKSRGVQVEVTTAESCRALDDQYDVVLAAAVLEHLYDPMQVLARVFKALRPGGLLFIDVPNEGSLAMKVGNLYQRIQGRNWSLNLSPTFPPYHVVGFSPRSLRYALEQLGFTIHKLDVVRYTNDVPDNSTIKRKVERMAMTVVQRVGKRLGMGDGLVCWARKPGAGGPVAA